MINWLRRIFSQPPRHLVMLHNVALMNFTYTPQPREWLGKGLRPLVVSNPYKPFIGDCDDYAATLAYQRLEATYAEIDGGKHAVCICDGWVLDNLKARPYRREGLIITREFSLYDAVKVKANGYKLIKKG